MSGPLRVAIVGCGWVAGSQIERGFALLRDRFEVAVCCDLDMDRAQDFARRHGVPEATDSTAAILERDDIDVVSICTPPSAHCEMAIAALERGTHVICEKPLTRSLELTDLIIAAEARSDARLMPIFQYRFQHGVQKARHLIASGIAGEAFTSSIETAWRRDSDYYDVAWRGKFETELGGVLLTQAIHIHDLFLWLMGEAAEVKAFKTTRVNPIEVEDCAAACLRMADGSLATLTATLGSVRPMTRLRLCFRNLVIERECFDADAPRPGNEPWTFLARTPELQAEVDRILAEAPSGEVDFAGQFADFAEALESRRHFAVSLDDARRSLELVTALFHSSETGETVPLPIGADHPRYSGWGPRP